MYIADLHIHSRYSRATSRECVPEYLDLWARRKGISLLGTGDFTHPAWRQELREKLVTAEDGLYCLREELRLKDRAPTGNGAPRFVVSGEISSIYKKNGRVRKVHNLILLPGLGEAELLARRLETIGNIHSDGRPILGLDSRDLLEITLEVCPRAIFVPAHIWTPHFSMLGAFSGFDTVEECFEDLAPQIHAIETGLSSDPPMNWRLSALDKFHMISNSDAHSPSRLGREANLLDIPMSYDGLYDAIQKGVGLAGTIEFFPEEGKYHYDGHRKCHLCLSPQEAEAYQGKCPVCGKKLTLGVSHRIQQLADRAEGFTRPGAVPFESLVPLPEVIAASTGHGAAGVRVQRLYEEMLGKLGTEFSILRELSIEDIRRQSGYQIGEGIRRLREGNVGRFPGFDGEYGTIQLFEPSELDAMEGQMSLFGQNGAGFEGRIRQEAKERKAVREGDTGKKMPQAAEAEGRRQSASSELLNEEQLLAVRSLAPRTAVIAGPGTGKTKTLISHILYLLQHHRVKPSDITAVTFTNKAAQEMRTRLKEQLGRHGAAGKIRIGTFHSICQELLRADGKEFAIADEGTVLELVREVAEELGIQENVKALRQDISRRKTALALETEGREAADADQLILCYEKRLSQLDAMDFDDLLIRALKGAEEGGEVFPYLLVDEFQDISPLQYRLIQAWSRGGREIFIIGDPDQAIYGFRGADAACFRRFCREEETQIIHLVRNYRSAPEILTAAETVLEGNGGTRDYSQISIPADRSVSKGAFLEEGTESGNLGRRLEPMQPPGLPVRLVEASGERAEAIFAAKEINRLVGGMDMLDTQEGFACPDSKSPRSFADIAVIYRTHRQAEILEACLKKEGIPYIVTGREEFLEEDMVRGSLGFFRSVVNPYDHLSRKLCLRLLWGVGEEDIARCAYPALVEKYEKACRRGKPRTLWDSWRADMELMEHPGLEKLSDMAVFYKTMEEMLTALAFGRESDLKRCGGKHYTADSVTLMTMHGSKGLEFPVVLLYGVKKGIMPLEYKRRDTDLDEERRLLYVAMTRAREELIMTASGGMSRFLEEAGGGSFVKEQTRQKERGWENGYQMSLFDL